MENVVQIIPSITPVQLPKAMKYFLILQGLLVLIIDPYMNCIPNGSKLCLGVSNEMAWIYPFCSSLIICFIAFLFWHLQNDNDQEEYRKHEWLRMLGTCLITICATVAIPYVTRQHLVGLILMLCTGLLLIVYLILASFGSGADIEYHIVDNNLSTPIARNSESSGNNYRYTTDYDA